MLRNGRKTELGLPLALGLSEVRAVDDRRTVIQKILYGGQSRFDTLVAGYLPCLLVLRYVEVAAQKHLFAAYRSIKYAFFVVVHNESPFKEKVYITLISPLCFSPGKP